jgi:hypothetical protein
VFIDVEQGRSRREGGPKDGGSRFLRNIGKHLPYYTASHPCREDVKPLISELSIRGVGSHSSALDGE